MVVEDPRPFAMQAMSVQNLQGLNVDTLTCGLPNCLLKFQ